MRCLTSSLLCSGFTSLNTLPQGPLNAFFFSSLLICSNFYPVKHATFCGVFSFKMCVSLATAMAVSCASPVIMITFTPAEWHWLMACFTSGRTGSLMQTYPTKLRLPSTPAYDFSLASS